MNQVKKSDPNRRKGGCLRYIATIYFVPCFFAFLLSAIFPHDETASSDRLLLVGLAALMAFFIWLMWRPKKNKATPATQVTPSPQSIEPIDDSTLNNNSLVDNSPIEGKEITIGTLHVTLMNGQSIDSLTGHTLSRQQLNSIRQHIALNRDRYEQIIHDCFKLIRSTNTPEVFFMRYNLLIETLEILTLYQVLFHATGDNHADTLRLLCNSRTSITCDFIERSHSDMIQKAATLKTEKGRRGRYEKYYQSLEPYLSDLPTEAKTILNLCLQQDGLSEPIQASSQQVTVAEPPSLSNDLPFAIPQDVLSLLWIKNGPLQNCTMAEANEPSAIDLTDPIDLSPSESDFTEDIGYYPSYARLTPKQKTVYLRWLQDITKPVPIGYVFIFYYGLERFLFTEKYGQALNMISTLRKYHDNNSLLSYSADAMLVGCLLQNRPDLIGSIDLDKSSSELYLYIKGYVAGRLSAQDLIDSCRRWGFTNTRYIKLCPDRFKSQLQNCLQEQFGEPLLPLSHTDYLHAKKEFHYCARKCFFTT